MILDKLYYISDASIENAEENRVRKDTNSLMVFVGYDIADKKIFRNKYGRLLPWAYAVPAEQGEEGMNKNEAIKRIEAIEREAAELRKFV